MQGTKAGKLLGHYMGQTLQLHEYRDKRIIAITNPQSKQIDYMSTMQGTNDSIHMIDTKNRLRLQFIVQCQADYSYILQYREQAELQTPPDYSSEQADYNYIVNLLQEQAD
ncbi:hypothetical protein AVEN_60908-1 [Araneus ventricosus]|uniref:Uncharacterized protein n=1 Tax=Araneus ventricosus TaxID=182803 RepID=A0A4Y2KMV1_ARAVE|nr:hypothetical protein AVEN_60908-1 [Araneus ventricosus]